MTNLDSILKSRDITLPTKVRLVNAIVFPVVMYGCDKKESWMMKNWCFWTVVLEKTLESLLDYNKIQPVHSKGDQSLVFIGRTDAKAATAILWPPQVKSWLTGKDLDAQKDWRQEEKGTTKDEMAGWYHQLDGPVFEQSPGVDDGQGGLVCCDSWGRKELDMTERLNWTELYCMDVRVGLCRRQSAEELMVLNCGVGEDSWESLGLQGDPTSPFWRRSTLGFLWKEWC